MRALADPDVTRAYVPESDRELPESERTTFDLGRLRLYQHSWILDQTAAVEDEIDSIAADRAPKEGEATAVAEDAPEKNGKEERVAIRINDLLMNSHLACRFGIRGWSNWRDDDGNEIPFSTEPFRIGSRPCEVVPESLVERIPHDVRLEIGMEIARLSRVTKDQEKKSPSP